MYTLFLENRYQKKNICKTTRNQITVRDYKRVLHPLSQGPLLRSRLAKALCLSPLSLYISLAGHFALSPSLSFPFSLCFSIWHMPCPFCSAIPLPLVRMPSCSLQYSVPSRSVPAVSSQIFYCRIEVLRGLAGHPPSWFPILLFACFSYLGLQPKRRNKGIRESSCSR